MTIKNKSKNTTLASNAVLAKSLRQRTKGLLGENKPQTMVFKTRFGIHTFGMKFSIDVIVLNPKHEVVKLKKIKPNKVFFWNPKFDTVLELPIGTIEKTKTTIGDNIMISETH